MDAAKPKGWPTRPSPVASLVRGLAAAVAVLLVAVLAAGLWLYHAVTALAAQTLSSVISGLAAYLSLLATFVAVVIAMGVITLLQTPPLLVVFGPLGRWLELGVRLWAGANGRF